MSTTYNNLSQNTVNTITSYLSIYLPASHIDALLHAFNAAVGDAVTQATTPPVGG